METLEVVLSNVGLVILLAFIVEVLVEHLVGKPLEVAAPEVDRWWLIYVALLSGGALGWFAQVNIFDGLLPVLVGRILTCHPGRRGVPRGARRGEEGARSIGGRA